MNDRVVRLMGGLVALGAVSLLFLNGWVHHAGRTAARVYQRMAVDPSRAALGRGVFVRVGCRDCHEVRDLAGDRGRLGPALDGVAVRAAMRRVGQDAQAYLFESIESPGAYVVEGYLNAMPALRERMTDQECADLVAFLLTLRTSYPQQGRRRGQGG